MFPDFYQSMQGPFESPDASDSESTDDDMALPPIDDDVDLGLAEAVCVSAPDGVRSLKEVSSDPDTGVDGGFSSGVSNNTSKTSGS